MKSEVSGTRAMLAAQHVRMRTEVCAHETVGGGMEDDDETEMRCRRREGGGVLLYAG
jgi:hypothetical protein